MLLRSVGEGMVTQDSAEQERNGVMNFKDCLPIVRQAK